MHSQQKENWLKERKTYIGGSNVAAVMRLNSYCTAVGIYLEKISPEIDCTMSEAAKWGILLENTIAKAYEEKTGFNVEIEPNVIYHKEHKFLAANIDRWANGKKHILECKTAGFMMAKEWGEEYTDQIPESYLCQVAYYAAICDVDRVDIAVLIGGQDFRIYTYNRNREFEEKIIKIAQNFWTKNILQKVPPKCINLTDTADLWPKSNGREILADDHIIKEIQELKIMQSEVKQLEEAIILKKVDIQEFMQDYDVLSDSNGRIIATWKNTSPRVALDIKRLQEEHKDIYQQYAKEKEGSRMFLIK